MSYSHAWSGAALMLLLPVALGASAWEDADTTAALADDGQCEAIIANASDCALNAMQLRGRRVVGSVDAMTSDEARGGGSCQDYGCVGYTQDHACQCNDKCQHYGDCCSDYQAQCAAPSNGQESCASYGCVDYVPEHACQCNENCQHYGNCCSDYQGQCAAPQRRQESCASYGCVDYVPEHGCQCNDRCQQYGDCCSDYKGQCTAPSNRQESCANYGCIGYMPEHACQCNDECQHYGDCCSDYAGACVPKTPTRHVSDGEIFGHPSATAEYPSYPGFSLMLVEEFDSPIDLDADPIWTWSDGGLSEGKARFVKENIKFEEGKMVIELSSTPPTHAQPCSHAEVDIIPDNKTATSGEIRTKHNMFRYGRYEVRMKAPTVQPSDPIIDGNFIATMFVFRDAKFKHWREIDIEITGDSSGRVSTNVITGENVSKFRDDMDHSKKYEAPFNVRADFHTYAFEWLPDRVTWFVDGKVIREEKLGKVQIPELSGKIIMNLWEFDKRALFGGKEIWNDRLPMRSEYDWFRFYKWDGETHYPCAGMGEDCLTEDDRYLSSNNPCDGIPQVGTVFGNAPCTGLCLAPSARMHGSCANYGCVGYVPEHACQCNDKCQHYGNCCSDYTAACVPQTSLPHSSRKAPLAHHSSGGEIFGHPSASAEYPSYPGFSLMLVEEFDSPIDLDADPIWTWSDGGLVEGQQRFVKENIKFEEGKMMIEASSEQPLHAQPCSHAEVDMLLNQSGTSGEIRTKHNMFRYGRYEVRMKAPTVQPSDPTIDGNFIATMFVFRDGKFKHWREIDFEITGDFSGSVTTNVLVAENTKKFREDIGHPKIYSAPFNVRADFHTYAFEWLPDRVTWFVDGKVIREEKLGNAPVPELPGKIMMNLWMYDKRAIFGGKEIWNDRLPMRSEYDWFRFYKWDGDEHYPCAGMGEDCLTEDDRYLSSNNPCDGIPQVGTVFGKAPCTARCEAL